MAAAGLAGLAFGGGDARAGAPRQVPLLEADWRDHFESLENGAILADTRARTLHFWSEEGGIYRLFPAAVPRSRDLARLGETRVIRKVEGPTWRPTPSMRERDPSLPARIGAGPQNPLGSHALYLSWENYRIHGTHDPRLIGGETDLGCIALDNAHVAELFALATVGTRVRLI